MNVLPIVIDGWQQYEPGRCEKDAVDSAKGRESHRHGDKEGKLAVEPASKCLQRLIVVICDRKPKQNSPQPLPQNQGLQAHWELCRRLCLLSRRRWWRWYRRSWLLGGDLWLGPSSPQSQSWGSSNHCKQRVLRGEVINSERNTEVHLNRRRVQSLWYRSQCPPRWSSQSCPVQAGQSRCRWWWTRQAAWRRWRCLGWRSPTSPRSSSQTIGFLH